MEQIPDRILYLNTEEKEQIKHSFRPRLWPAKQCWIEQGERCNEIVFIETGYFRVFHSDQKPGV
jgi:hypothetical protein